MTRLLFVYVALAALTLLVFAVWPALDLAFSRLFYQAGFAGDVALGRFARDVFRVTPFVALALHAALWLLERAGVPLRWAPSGRAMIFLVATMVIGPGLIVNLGFKDHWHRPRPSQTEEFNGPDAFRPWYDDKGSCKRNCSFVSGEASTGFWMAAPASVLPPPWRGPATIAAFAFGIGASLLRVAAGGHYLSDVLLGGLLTLFVIEIARLLVWPPDGGERRRSPPAPESRTAAELVDAARKAARGKIAPRPRQTEFPATREENREF
jgi:membrane-associated phospholipid phosphatase